MTRQEATNTIQVYTKNPALISHLYATEASMRAIARVFAQRFRKMADEEHWGLAGLLHDADYELTRKTPERHTLYLEERLGKVIPSEVMHAIKSHNSEHTAAQPVNSMDWALYSCDELTGIIITCAREKKDKKLSSVTVDDVINKLQDPSFAKSIDRAQIVACEQNLGLTLKEFVGIVLVAMQAIAVDLGFAE
jgi:hypothetical protein